MNIKSSLETFSLLELFQLIDSGSKSGKLTIQIPPEFQLANKKSTYHIWFDKGKLVAITINSERSDLITSIESRGWLKRRVIEKLEDLCRPEVPLGTHLKNMGVLKPEQLQLLFQIKLEQIYYLFEQTAERANYQVTFAKIKPNSFPWMEMTGVRIQARQVALLALRKIRKWDDISEFQQLPAPTSTLEKITIKPDFVLDPLELFIWKKADGNTTIEAIAKQLHQSLPNIQRVTFRLIVAGLLVEISQSQAIIRASLAPKPLFPIAGINNLITSLGRQIEKQPALSLSWLQSLVSFTLLIILLT